MAPLLQDHAPYGNAVATTRELEAAGDLRFAYYPPVLESFIRDTPDQL